MCHTHGMDEMTHAWNGHCVVCFSIHSMNETILLLHVRFLVHVQAVPFLSESKLQHGEPPVPLFNAPQRRRLHGKRSVTGDLRLPQRPGWLSNSAAVASVAASSDPAAVASSRVRFTGATQRCMPASQCRRGSAMEHLAKEMVKELKADPRCQPAISAKRTFRFGTMCSGSEITGVSLKMLQVVCIEWN